MKIFLRDITDSYADEVRHLDDYEFRNYWTDLLYILDDDSQLFAVTNEGGEQVALIEIDRSSERDTFQDAYPIPSFGDPILEIQMIDVRESFRNKGVGTLIISELSKLFPGRALLALSEGADEFWRGLGWSEVLPKDRKRTMFIAQ